MLPDVLFFKHTIKKTIVGGRQNWVVFEKLLAILGQHWGKPCILR